MRSPARARRSTGSRPRLRSGRRSSREATVAGSRALSPEAAERLRALPSVEELAASIDGVSHVLAVQAARAGIAAERERIRGPRERGGTTTGGGTAPPWGG